MSHFGALLQLEAIHRRGGEEAGPGAMGLTQVNSAIKIKTNGELFSLFFKRNLSHIIIIVIIVLYTSV